MYRKLILIITAIYCGMMSSFATQDGPMRRLLTRPDSIADALVLNIPESYRLDMVDYYEADRDDYTPLHYISTFMRVDSIDENYARLSSKAAVNYDLYIVAPASDSLLVTVNHTPVGNGEDIVVVKDMATAAVVDQPVANYTDWLAEKALDSFTEDEIIAAVPYVTSVATVDADRGEILLTNTAVTVPGLDERIAALFVPQLKYRWNGKKFVKVKK